MAQTTIRKEQLSDSDYIRVYLSSDFTTTSTSTTKINFNATASSSGSSLSLSSGTIVIGSGVSRVRVSGNTYYTTGVTTGDLMKTELYLNTTLSNVALWYGRTYTNGSLPEIILPVSTSDTIEIRTSNSARTGSTLDGHAYGTWLQVEVVD